MKVVAGNDNKKLERIIKINPIGINWKSFHIFNKKAKLHKIITPMNPKKEIMKPVCKEFQ